MAIASLLAFTACQSSQWSGLGGDPGSTFHNRRETKLSTSNVSRLAPIWETTQLGNINGAPAVVGDTVYILSREGTFAMRASNGERIWSNLTITGTSSPAYAGDVLFVNDVAATVHALDARTGRELWKTKLEPHLTASGLSSPIVQDEYVITGTSSTDEIVDDQGTSNFRGSVVALDKQTGREIWRHYTVDPPSNGVAVWSSVSIDPELRLVFVSTGNNYTGEPSKTSDAIMALDLGTGRRVWCTQLEADDLWTIFDPVGPDADFGANPMLFEGTIDGVNRKLVGAGQKSGAFWALDRRTGHIVWSQKISGGSSSGGIMNNGAYDGTRILVAGNTGSSTAIGGEPSNGESLPIANPTTSVLKALDPATGSVLWERQLPAWVWAPITIANGVGFVAYEKQMQAFDVRDGTKLFNYKTKGTITSAPVPVNGAVYFGSGLTYIVGWPDRTMHALAIDGVRVGGEDPDAATPDAGHAPGTFSSIYEQLISGQGCASVFCHGASAGNLLLASKAQAYMNLVGVAAKGPACGIIGMKRVDPGRPDTSLLLDKIAHSTPSCGGVMPPSEDGGTTVPEELLMQVRAWILAGAPNN
jgi:polyvinyl alcohol dehydrogenase (cytochrome)